MSANSSTNAKKDILRRYSTNPFLVKILQYTYHPLKKFYVTSSGLQKRKNDLCNSLWASVDIFDLLDQLIERKLTGHDAIAAVNGYISGNQDCEEIVYQIIDKNLKTRATATIINEIIPNCIPVFKVQLAEKFHEYVEKIEREDAKLAKEVEKEKEKADTAKKTGKKYVPKEKKERKYKLNFENDTWYLSIKLDGVRCVCIVDETGNATFWSRGGNEFLTLGKVKEAIEKLGLKNVVFDGEMCIRTDDDRDDFQGIMSEINNKDHTIERPLYYIFDFLTLDNFYNCSDKKLFSARLVDLVHALYSDSKPDSPYYIIHDQVVARSEKDIAEHLEMAISKGREGSMLKRNTRYQNDRTNDMLKVKRMHDAEYVVESIVSDYNRVVENGKEVEIMMLAAVYIRHKGDPVKVGSGFTKEEKIRFHADPSKIIGKTITVQYQEESIDQHGKNSLRFPVVKYIYENGRTI